MATVTPNQLTLVELVNRQANGSAIPVVRALSQVNMFMNSAIWQEANGTTGHKVSRRTALPTGNKRRFNDGVAREKSSTTQVTESMEMLESWSDVDSGLVKIAADPVQFRADEDEAHLEGMGQTFASDFISGNVNTNPDSMHGLAPRRASLGDNVIGGGGTGNDVSSIYVIRWSPRDCYFIFPKGSQIGIDHEDLGEGRVEGATAATWYKAWQSHFAINVGLAVADERSLQRYANIESAGSSNIFDEDSLIEAISNLPAEDGNISILMNKVIKKQFDIAVKDRSNVDYQPGDPFGRPITHFMGHPIHTTEAIGITETALT